MTRSGARGVYPGSFDPLTIAHLAIAEKAVHEAGLDHLDLALSRAALGKEDGGHLPLDDARRRHRARVHARVRGSASRSPTTSSSPTSRAATTPS